MPRFKTKEEFDAMPDVLYKFNSVYRESSQIGLSEDVWGQEVPADCPIHVYEPWMYTNEELTEVFDKTKEKQMIAMDKEYQTRDGQKVKLYTTEGGGEYPLHGAVYVQEEGGYWEVTAWTEGGSFYASQSPSMKDLIEVPKIIKAWVNIYPFSDGYVYKTREEADKAADFNRIACVQIEFKKGEGL